MTTHLIRDLSGSQVVKLRFHPFWKLNSLDNYDRSQRFRDSAIAACKYSSLWLLSENNLSQFAIIKY
jgi:hypothetical protein